MSQEKIYIEPFGNAEIEALKRLSAHALPDDPARHGMKAERVKGAFWKPFVEGKNAVIGLLNQLITSLNGLLAEQETVNSTNSAEFKEIRDGISELGNGDETVYDTETGTLGFSEGVKSLLTAASEGKPGVMSATDKKNLDTLVSLLGEEAGDDNDVVDKIREVLAAFASFPEGDALAATLSQKLDKVTDPYTGSNPNLDKKRVYAVDHEGNQRMLLAAATASGEGAIPLRTAGSGIVVSLEPAGIQQATSKYYVDNLFNGANKAISYESYEAMVKALNKADATEYSVGQNIMIVKLDVPDLWVSKVNETAAAYTYTNDAAIVDALKENDSITVGYYVLSALETQKVDLSTYASKEAVENLENSKLTAQDGTTNPPTFNGHGWDAGALYLYGIDPRDGWPTQMVLRSVITPAEGRTSDQTIMRRDSYGRSKVNDPVDERDIVNIRTLEHYLKWLANGSEIVYDEEAKELNFSEDVRALLNDATPSTPGVMSATDKKNLDTLVSLLGEEADDDNDVVDKLVAKLETYIDEKLATNTTDGLRLIHTCTSGFNAGAMTCSCDGDPITNGKFVIASIVTSISLSKDGSIEEEYPHVPFTWIIPCSHLCNLEAGSEESISTTQTVHTVYPDGTKFVGLYSAYREADNAYNFCFGVSFEDTTEYDVSISGTFEIEVYG